MAKPSQKRKNGTTVRKTEKWAKAYQKRRMAMLAQKLKDGQNLLRKGSRTITTILIQVNAARKIRI
jgi:hypothetical protein